MLYNTDPSVHIFLSHVNCVMVQVCNKFKNNKTATTNAVKVTEQNRICWRMTGLRNFKMMQRRTC